jgi:hypothetical protein
MILTGETRRTRRDTRPSTALFAWSDQEEFLGLRGNRPAKKGLSHCKASMLVNTFYCMLSHYKLQITILTDKKLSTCARKQNKGDM